MQDELFSVSITFSMCKTHHINFKTSDFCGMIELCDAKAKMKECLQAQEKKN